MHVRRMRVLHAILPWLLGGLGVVAAFPKTISSGFAWVPGDTGDALLNNYSLEHAHRWLIGVRALFWDYPIFYPQRGVAGFSETWLGLLPLYSPIRLAGFAPETAFPILLIVISGLNFFTAYRLLRGPLKLGPFSAACGAFIFAFGSVRLNQLNHAQLLPQFFSVLALNALLRWFSEVTPSARRFWIAILFASSAAQIYASFYLGWLWAFVLLIALVWSLLLRALRLQLIARLKDNAWAVLTCAILSSLSLIPLIAGYLNASRIVGLREFWELEGQLPRFQSWFDMGNASWLYGWTNRSQIFRQLEMEHEHRLGLGLLTTTLLIVTLYRRRNLALDRIFALSIITVILLSTMYRYGVSPWTFVFHVVPGAKAIRAVSRIGLMLLIPAAIALARWIDDAAGRRRWVTYAVALGCLLEQGQYPYAFDTRKVKERVARLTERVDPHCGAFFYASADAESPSFQIQTDAIWANLANEIPTVNGYSGNSPPGWNLDEPVVRTPKDEERLRGALSQWMRRNGRTTDEVCWVTDLKP